MTDKAEPTPDVIFASILGNLMAYDGIAPHGEVSQTYRILVNMRRGLDLLLKKPIKINELERMAREILEARGELHNFDSGANRMAVEIADQFRREMIKQIHDAVCKAAGVPPNPSSGLSQLQNARNILIDANGRLARMEPKSTANLSALIAQYDKAIKILYEKSTAATVVRKHPGAKKSVLS